MESSADTIAAVATPPGQGGVGIIRISGPQALSVAAKIADAPPLVAKVQFTQFRDRQGDVIDQGLLLSFAGPRSFTGEDVAEFQIHGGPYLLTRLLEELCQYERVRLARPGEFSERAFHNGKLDLIQAEAIADLIAAGSDAAVRAAQRSLSGVFSRRCRSLHQGLIDLRVRLEAAIDFPEEEIDFLSDPELHHLWQRLHVEHAELIADTAHGVQLSQGVRIVLAGPPNSGKSSLLNFLSKRDMAIVTPIAGTTRDLLTVRLELKGMPVELIDTAGLRESSDLVEQEGIRRARAAVESADFLLHVMAPDSPRDTVLTGGGRLIEVHNKCDLSGAPPGWADRSRRAIHVSAKTGAGITLLIDELVGDSPPGGGEFSARQRHLDALRRCGEHLVQAGRRLSEGAGDLCAEELNLAQKQLGQITGEVHSDDLLGHIFSSFCIGK